MSEDRMKVKDLATDLGLQTKDLLAAAKEMNITAAKVGASSLSEQEVSRLRNHFTASEKSDDVIVRRRPRKGASQEISAQTAATTVPAESTASSDAGESPAQESGAPASAEITGKARPAVEGKARKVEQSARIISKAGDVEKEEPAVAQVAAPSEEAPKASVTEPAVKQEVPLATTDEGAHDAQAEGHERAQAAPSEDASVKKAQTVATKHGDDAAKKGGARIVRPAVFSAEPEKSADGRTVSSAPVLAKNDSHTDESDVAGEGPVTGGVRVISRPDPNQQRRPAATDRGGRDFADKRDDRGSDRGADRQPRTDRRPGGAPRPAGGAPRPAGGAPRPAGNRPAFGAPQNAGAGFSQDRAPRPAFEQPTDGESRRKRQKGRRTVDFSSGPKEGDDASWNRASGRRKKGGKREVAPIGGTQPQKAVKRKIKVEEFIKVGDLAHQMGLKSGEIIKTLFNLGVMATINQSLDIETATLVAIEFGYEIEKVGFSAEDLVDAQREKDAPETLKPRPPVVTIMGHVDHGKTSLLDAIRKSSVASGEAGGITQHIGAYHVTTKKGEIVFLDTPGHEAFTAMRARGAEITDIVVLVVAADDGVMEQTREAINHAKAANVPIMVAVNKIDKPGADPDRVKRELSENGLVAEDWGGDTVFAYVSAKQGTGIDELLDLLALQAEILELKANPDKPAIGHIIEAKLDKGRGALGTVLIQEGTLHLGDTFVCGTHSGRVRSMFNDQGKKVKEATPSMPVEVQGFEGVPEAGEEFICIADEKSARRIADVRSMKQRERDLARDSSKVTLETFLAAKPGGVETVTLNLVVKSDVQGSLEAIIDAMNKLSNEKVRIAIVHGGTGAISESDVLLAAASSAIIIGFNVRPIAKAKGLAEQEKVDIRYYDIIYKLVEEIKSAMEGMLAPVIKEVELGSAEVREVFSVPKIGAIAGCHVQDGKIVRNSGLRLLRDGVVVHTGKVGSLRRFKDDVKEVQKGYECGIGIENYNDIKVGDVIEAFETVEEAATL